MDLQALKLQASIAAQLRVGNDESLHNCTLLGLCVGKSVLLSTPMLGPARPLLLRKDQSVMLRFYAQGCACSFQSKVKHLCTTPYHYLHLYYPSKIHTEAIRRAKRVMASLRVTVLNKSQSHYDRIAGGIIDISTLGAKLETVEPIGQVGDTLMITTKVNVGRVSRLVNWDAQIKTELDQFEMRNTLAAYGVDFLYLQDMDYLALHAYVHSQTVKGAELDS